MTVVTENSFLDYVANGIATVYPYNFKITASSDMTVYFNGVLFGSGNYIVTGAGLDSGGDVVFTQAPAGGVVITLQRETPATQEVDLLPYDPFPAETIEDSLDKLTLLFQQNENELNDRVVRLPVGLPNVSPLLPIPQAGAALAWGQDGKTLVNAGLDITVQRVTLVSAQPIGNKTGIGQAWNDAGLTVTGSIVIAFYGGVSYWLGNLNSPSADSSWEFQVTVTWYQDAITFGGIVSWERLLLLGTLNNLVEGSVVLRQASQSQALYQLKAGGDPTVDPYVDTNLINSGIGANWINLIVNNAPVRRSEADSINESISILNFIAVSGTFSGLLTRQSAFLQQETNIGTCSSRFGLGVYIQSYQDGNIGVITKDANSSWELLGSGGLASSVNLADRQWLGFFALMNFDGSVTSLGWDSHPNALNLLADAAGDGIDTYRQIYWNQIVESSPSFFEINPYAREGTVTLWKIPKEQNFINFFNGTLITVDAPPNSIAILQVFADSGVGNTAPWGGIDWRISSVDQPDEAVTKVNATVRSVNYDSQWSDTQTAVVRVKVDGNSQIRIRSNHTSIYAGLYVRSVGFEYDPSYTPFPPAI